MRSMRTAVVAGLAAAAATGLATPAWAVPAKASVTSDQCTHDHGRVQRAKDGVGTCVGGTDDGHLIKDVSTAKRADGSTSKSGTSRPGYGGATDTRRSSDADGRGSYRDDDRSSDRPSSTRDDDRSSESGDG